MEPILTILDCESGLTSLWEWRSNALKMSWTEEFGWHCVAAKDTDWISRVVELGTVDVDLGATSEWASQRRDLRKTWWIEEDELKPIGNILVVKGELELHADERWIHIIWWADAPGLSGGDNLGWPLTEGTEDTEGIIGIIDVVDEVKWHEVVALEDDLGSAANRSEIW